MLIHIGDHGLYFSPVIQPYFAWSGFGFDFDSCSRKPYALGRFLEQLFRFVDLGCEVRAASTVVVVQQHQRAVCLANLVFGDGAFTVAQTLVSTNPSSMFLRRYKDR